MDTGVPPFSIRSSRPLCRGCLLEWIRSTRGLGLAVGRSRQRSGIQGSLDGAAPKPKLASPPAGERPIPLTNRYSRGETTSSGSHVVTEKLLKPPVPVRHAAADPKAVNLIANCHQIPPNDVHPSSQLQDTKTEVARGHTKDLLCPLAFLAYLT